MRVAVIAPPWLPVPPPAYGGTEAVVDALASGLASIGHEVVLFAHPDSTCPVPICSIVPPSDTKPMGRASIEIEHAVGAYRQVATGGFDVVSDHTIAGPVHCCAYPQLPVVATNHNPFSRTRNAIYATLIGRGAIVAISHSHARSTHLPMAAVIHHGIDVDAFPFGTGGGGYLAMLTRMSPDKGVRRAIEIARRAGAKLLIAAKVGDSQEHEYFDAVIRPQLYGDIEFLGEVGFGEKQRLLADATALLNPIEWSEPFGMAMLESLACGTPVIATPRGAAPEIVVHGVSGFLTETDDDLVDAVGKIGGLDRYACRQRAIDEFSVTAMAQRYASAFGDEIERHRTRAALSPGPVS